MASKTKPAFAVWITGLPASSKSTVTAALKARLDAAAVDVAVLESDVLRKVLTPHPHYDEAERDTFYSQMVFIGALLVEHGVPVIFDATANRRAYRDRARLRIANFLEIFVDSPLETCMARDPKGIYKAAGSGASSTVPGLQSSYQPPERPDLVIHGDRELPDDAASRIVHLLQQRHLLSL